jgi:hypothetical protein
LKTQFEESSRLEAEIKKNLAGLGFDVWMEYKAFGWNCWKYI